MERAIRQKLLRFPISKREKAIFILDQEINDRGLQVDMLLTRQAIDIDKQHSEQSMGKAQKLTGLDNPNSVKQLKEWLYENGVETDNLSKETISQLISETSGNIEKLLKLRQQLSKTSVKKYEAIERSVCPDGRVRELFKYYGANRKIVCDTAY